MFTLQMELHGSEVKQFCWVNTPVITGELPSSILLTPLTIPGVNPGCSYSAMQEVLTLLLSALFANTGVQTTQLFTQTLNQQL